MSSGKSGGGCGCLVILLIVGLIGGAGTVLGDDEGTVVSVTDGSHLVVDVDGEPRLIALAGVAVPKSADGEGPECLAEESKVMLAGLATPGLEVELEDLEDDGTAKVKRADESGYFAKALIDAGLGVDPERESYVHKGLYSDEIPCTLPAQIASLKDEEWDLRMRSRETSAAIAGTLILIDELRTRGVELAEAIRTERDGAFLIARHERTREGLSRDLDSALSSLDRFYADLDRDRVATAQREEAAAARRAEQAARDAEWEAGRAAREAESLARRQQYEQAHGNTSDTSGRGDDGYTGRRCYDPGGRTYKPC